ncbi:hypothetical protein [Photobacterium leiognathi]|nr:hypothetical protein [Photobacterium leiognathi]
MYNLNKEEILIVDGAGMEACNGNLSYCPIMTGPTFIGCSVHLRRRF